MTVCKGCKRELNEDQFYRQATMATGRLLFCKECVRGRAKKYYQENKERAAKRQAEYAAKNPDVIARSRSSWATKNPEKRRAHSALNHEVRRGRTVKPKSCEVCGAQEPLHAHHDDYSKPLEVRWLCQRHHVEIHRMAREAAK
jgi:hypothetical protein